MIKKLMHVALALALVFGAVSTASQQAEARGGRGLAIGIAAGIIGLGIAAGAARAHDRHYSRYDDGGGCFRGPRRCHWENQRCFENRYGEYVCRGGDYVCGRPLICD